MHEPKYIKTGDKFVALVGKTGSSAICRAITLKHCPDYRIVSGSGNKEMEQFVYDSPMWHNTVERVDEPETPPLIPIREPVERFLSACAEEKIEDIDSLLDQLEEGERLERFHFRPASRHMREGAKLFKFPEQLDELAEEIGVDEITLAHKSKVEKPTLTKNQLERVRKIYADDISIFKSIQ